MVRSALQIGLKEARPSRLTPRDPWSTSLRLPPRAARSAASRDSNFDDHGLRHIEGIAYNRTISL